MVQRVRPSTLTAVQNNNDAIKHLSVPFKQIQ